MTSVPARAKLGQQVVETGVLERPVDDVDRMAHQALSLCEQLPVPEVSGRNDVPLATDDVLPVPLRLRAQEPDPLADVARAEIVEPRDLRREPAEAAKRSPQHLAPPGLVAVGKRVLQVLHADPAEPRGDEHPAADDPRHEVARTRERQRAEPGQQRPHARVLDPLPPRWARLLVAARHGAHAVPSAGASTAASRTPWLACPCSHRRIPVPWIADRRASGYVQAVSMRTSKRGRGATFDRLLPALVLGATLALQGCPVTSMIGAKAPGGTDPGPPTVFDPSMLDRG